VAVTPNAMLRWEVHAQQVHCWLHRSHGRVAVHQARRTIHHTGGILYDLTTRTHFFDVLLVAHRA
jgi:hypothetical protein